MNDPPIRILLAEDSIIFVSLLKEILSSTHDLEIIQVVDNGEDAVQACAQLQPDIVLMDVQMPRLDGLSATEQIMAQCPTPILIITADPFQGGIDISFKALSAGALDLYPKTRLNPTQNQHHANQELIAKIRLLSQIPVIRHVRGRRKSTSTSTHYTKPTRTITPPRSSSPMLIGITSSTGGPKALATICQNLPANLPATLLIVQHITHGFTSHLAKWLDANSPLNALEATDQMRPKPGSIIIAPGGRHMTLNNHGTLRLKRPHTSFSGHCPSGDILLKSLARNAHPDLTLGIILSGMGDDGAQGLLHMQQQGCTTIAQDKESSVVWGMPKVAHQLGASKHLLNPTQIASFIVEFCAQTPRR